MKTNCYTDYDGNIKKPLGNLVWSFLQTLDYRQTQQLQKIFLALADVPIPCGKGLSRQYARMIQSIVDLTDEWMIQLETLPLPKHPSEL